MANQISLWGRLGRSTWQPEAFRDVAQGSVASMFGYLAVLIVVATTAITFMVHVAMSAGLEAAIPRIQEDFPELRITNGKVSSPVEQPYIQDYEGFAFIIDTTGATTSLADYEQGLLITEQAFIIKQSRRETRRYEFTDVPDTVIDSATVEGWIHSIQQWLWLVVAIVLFIWQWFVKLAQILCGSLLGLLVNTITGRGLPYRGVFNLSIYAATIPTCFDLIRQGVGWYGAGWSIVGLACYIGYLIWGIFVQRSPASSANPAQPSAGPSE